MLALNACGIAINNHHPSLQNISEDTGTVKVYFIRPVPAKSKGVADNTLRIDFKNEELLEIAEGYYTLVEIRPDKGEITTHSKTIFTTNTQPIEVARSRFYEFIAGRTYFIHVKRLNEEFRGIYYDPAPVTLSEAKMLVEGLSARGAARSEPIEDIETVPDIPEQGQLEPALPEKLYPQSPYLLKKPKKQ